MLVLSVIPLELNIFTTVITLVRDSTFCEVWKKELLYFGVVIGNLG